MKLNNFQKPRVTWKKAFQNDFRGSIDALNVKTGMLFDDPDNMDSWEMEIETIIALLKIKTGKNIWKIYKPGEVLRE